MKHNLHLKSHALVVLFLALALPRLDTAPVFAQDLGNKIEAISSSVRNGDLNAVKAGIEADPKVLASPRSQAMLLHAVQNGKVDVLKYLLEKKLDPNAEVYGNPILTSAATYWGPEWRAMVDLLAENGAKINATNSEGQTALWQVVNYGGIAQKDKVAWLLSKGADINVRNRYGGTPLEIALNGNYPDIVPLILEKADVKRADENGNTPLFAAVARNKVEYARQILDKGADVNARNSDGDTVLHIGARMPGAMLKALLDAGARTDIRNNRGDLPLHVALRRGGESGATARVVSIDGVAPVASEEGTPRGTLLAPLTEKSDINAKDQFGISPLLLAIIARDQESRDIIMGRGPKMDATTQLFDAASQGNLALMKTILTQKPFLVYFRLPDGTTPLHVSALWGTLGAAQLLVQKGADVNARDSRGETPLLKTLWRPTGLFARRSKNMMAFLLEKKADSDAQDVDGSTALHRTVRVGDDELIAPLLAKNVNINARDKSGETPIFGLMNKVSDIRQVQTLIDRGAELNIRPQSGGSLLARAAQIPRRDIVQLLLEKGADVGLKDLENRSPLGSMLFFGAQGEESAAVAELLLAKGADPNEKIWGDSLVSRIISNDSKEMLRVFLASKKVSFKGTAERQSPLFQAVNYGRNEMVAMLLEAGADPDEVNEQGQTPAQIAVTRSKEMADLFKPKTPATG